MCFIRFKGDKNVLFNRIASIRINRRRREEKKPKKKKRRNKRKQNVNNGFLGSFHRFFSLLPICFFFAFLFLFFRPSVPPSRDTIFF